MSDTNKMTYDPIPVGGPFGPAPSQPDSKPMFSRSATEPTSTGGLLPPSRKPVSVANTEKPLPPGIAPETPTVPADSSPTKAGVGSMVWDLVKPTRGKGAVLAGLLSLGAGAYGLNLVVPQQPQPQTKVMSEPGREVEAPARLPSLTIERGEAPKVEQVRQEQLKLVSNTELPLPAPEKLPELPPAKGDTKLPDLPPASGAIDLPKSEKAAPLPSPSDITLTEEKLLKEKPLPLPTPAESLPVVKAADEFKLPPPAEVIPKQDTPRSTPDTALPLPKDSLPLPTSTIPDLTKVGNKAEEAFTTPPAVDLKPIKPEPVIEKRPEVLMVPKNPTPVAAPKVEEAKFSTPPTATASLTGPSKTVSQTTPKTDYDEDIVRVRSSDTYASLAKAHYEDDRYAAALKEYNKGIDIGLTREIQVPPLYVLKKISKETFDRFEPATRPVSATAPVIIGPVMDAPTVKPENNDMEWSKPGTPKRQPSFGTITTEREGLTPKQLARQLLGDAGEWRKLTNVRGQQFGEEEGLPRGTEVRYPKLQAEWR